MPATEQHPASSSSESRPLRADMGRASGSFNGQKRAGTGAELVPESQPDSSQEFDSHNLTQRPILQSETSGDSRASSGRSHSSQSAASDGHLGEHSGHSQNGSGNGNGNGTGELPGSLKHEKSDEKISFHVDQVNKTGRKRPAVQRGKSHQRLTSHTKPPVQAPRQMSTSVGALAGARPHLGRSKSTDGLLKGAPHRGPQTGVKRNNRSFTKLTSLHPLTRSTSNQSLKVAGLRPLTKTLSNQLLKSNKSNTSLKNLNMASVIGLKTSGKKGKAILKLNDDTIDDEYESDDSQTAPPPAVTRSELELDTGVVTSLKDLKELKVLQNLKLDLDPPEQNHDKDDDTVSLHSNLYGGLLLLSQSTGLTRKIDTQGYEIPSKPEPDFAVVNESISGISFQANPIDLKIAEPVTTNQTVVPPNSYQPNQTIFNNLQRTNSQYKKSQQFAGNNFSNFLNTGSNSNSSFDTRTQQRLWLQRENSLIDMPSLDTKSSLSNVSLNKMMFAHYNQSASNLREYPSTPTATLGPLTPSEQNPMIQPNGQQRQQNLLQSRTEFERLNREYLNVRRNLNPVAESLNRVEEIVAREKGIHVAKNNKKPASVANDGKNANTFHEFSPLYEEKQSEIKDLLEKIWSQAQILYSPKPQLQQPVQQQLPMQRTKTVQPTTRKLQKQQHF